MSGNLFTDLYDVKENMFHGANAADEIASLREQVAACIDGHCKPEHLHYLMFKMTNQHHGVGLQHSDLWNSASWIEDRFLFGQGAEC